MSLVARTTRPFPSKKPTLQQTGNVVQIIICSDYWIISETTESQFLNVCILPSLLAGVK